MKHNSHHISNPSMGSGIQGIAEDFKPHLSTGTSQFNFPLALPKARELTPQLVLEYSSGYGNDVFGVGFNMSHMSISRSTKFGASKYDDTKDIFTSSLFGELVPVDEPPSNNNAADNQGYQLQYFRPRVDNTFADIIHFIPSDKKAKDTDDYWEIREPTGITHRFGGKTDETVVQTRKSSLSPNSALADPCITHPSKQKVFRWCLNETINAKGDREVYVYEADQDDQSNTQTQRYLASIYYGNYQNVSGKGERFAFEVRFDYGKTINIDDYHLQDKQYDLEKAFDAKSRGPSSRRDSLQNYRAGFLITTTRLCRVIAVYHHFDRDPESYANNFLSHLWLLDYNDKQTQTDPMQASLSCLHGIRSIGCTRLIQKTSAYLIKATPDVEFDYTKLTLKDGEKAKFTPMSLSTKVEMPGLSGRFHLLDLYSEGLPGIYYNDGYSAYFWRSNGNGEFGAPQQLETASIGAYAQSSQIKRVGIDKKMAMEVHTDTMSMFYPLKPLDCYNTTNTDCPVEWCDPIVYEQVPSGENHIFSLDITSNNQSDLIVFDSYQPHYYPANGEKGYLASQSINFGEGQGDPLTSSDPYCLSTFADIFGDGQLHRIQITQQSMRIWPNLGHGKFGSPIEWSAPNYEQYKNASGKTYDMRSFDPGHIYLVDVDGSGTADLMYVYEDRVLIYLNTGTKLTSQPIEVFFPDEIRLTNLDQINIGDVLGMGVNSLMLTLRRTDELTHYFMPLSESKPHLLNKIVNHLGSTTSIQYQSSTNMYLKRRDSNATDPSKFDANSVAKYPVLPFVMPVMESVTVTDNITGLSLIHQYSYLGGSYNFRERRFSGFARVDQWDTEKETLNDKNAPAGAPDSPVATAHIKRWFMCGVENPESIYKKDYYDFNAYGTDNTLNDQSVRPTHLVNQQGAIQLTSDPSPAKMQAGVDEATQREFYLSLQGRILREEVFEEGATVPYHIKSHGYIVMCEQAPSEQANLHGIFVPKPQEILTFDLEQFHGQEAPRINHTIMDWQSENGFVNLINQITVAYGRDNMNDLSLEWDDTKKDGVNLASNELDRIQALQADSVINLSHHEFLPIIYSTDNLFCYKHEPSSQWHLMIDNKLVFDNSTELLAAHDVLNKLHSLLPKTFKIDDLAALPDSFKVMRCQQIHYWNKTFDDISNSTDSISNPPLVHHHSSLVGFDTSESKFTDNYQSLEQLSETSTSVANLLTNEAGYKQLEQSTKGLMSYWSPSRIHHYSQKNYYQLGSLNEFSQPDLPRKEWHYDSYSLTIKHIIDYYPQTVSEEGTSTQTSYSHQFDTDYQRMIPCRVIDPNLNSTLYAHDPLGVAIGMMHDGSIQAFPFGDQLTALDDGKNTLIENRTLSFNGVIIPATHRLIEQLLNLKHEDILSAGSVLPSAITSLLTQLQPKTPSNSMLGAWHEITHYEFTDTSNSNKTPSYSLHIKRKNYHSNPVLNDIKANDNQSAEPLITVSYLNGFATIIQTKTFSDVNKTDKLSQEVGWQTSGLSLKNSKGLTFKQYLPYYSDKMAFENEATQLQHYDAETKPHWIYYDALDRLSVTFIPCQSGYYQTRSVHRAWSHLSFDEYDTLIDSDPAGEHASTHANTPHVTCFAATGSICAEIKLHREINNATLTADITTITLDSLGQVLAYQDARLSSPNTHFKYDLSGNVIEEKSVDSGTRIDLHHHRGHLLYRVEGDVSDKTHEAEVDSVFWVRHYQLDPWHRPLNITVRAYQKANTNSQLLQTEIIEALTYGDQATQAFDEKSAAQSSQEIAIYQAINSFQQVTQRVGPDTTTEYKLFDINGHLLKQTQTLHMPTIEEVLAADGPIESDNHQDKDIEFTTTMKLNPLGQVVIKQFADQSFCLYSTNKQGQLTTIDRQNSTSGTPQSIVNKIDYLATSQHQKFHFGEGFTTSFDYDPNNRRLIRIKTQNKNNDPLQDLIYTRDPVGNISSLNRNTSQLTFKSQHSKAGMTLDLSDVQLVNYQYNTLYQVSGAEGRQFNQSMSNDSQPTAKPIAADMRGIPHAFVDKTINLELTQYGELYTYDSGENLLEIKHAPDLDHKSIPYWTVTHEVEPNSNKLQNRIETLQPDNTTDKEQKQDNITYDELGNITQLSDKEKLSWDARHQLGFFSRKEEGDTEEKTIQTTEHYGYASQDRTSLYQQKWHSINQHGNNHVLSAMTHRVYKLLCLAPTDEHQDIIEIVSIEEYERKRVYRFSLDEKDTAPNLQCIFERHSIHIHDEHRHIATMHHWIKDDAQLETQAGQSFPYDEVIYHLSDNLDSVSIDIDAQGQVLSYQEYTAFGSIAFMLCTDEQTLRRNNHYYSSEQRDASNLYYYGERYYAPWLGRWMSNDPAGYVNRLNKFIIVNNQSINYYDSFGLNKGSKTLVKYPKSIFTYKLPSKFHLDKPLNYDKDATTPEAREHDAHKEMYRRLYQIGKCYNQDLALEEKDKDLTGKMSLYEKIDSDTIDSIRNKSFYSTALTQYQAYEDARAAGEVRKRDLQSFQELHLMMHEQLRYEELAKDDIYKTTGIPPWIRNDGDPRPGLAAETGSYINSCAHRTVIKDSMNKSASPNGEKTDRTFHDWETKATDYLSQNNNNKIHNLLKELSSISGLNFEVDHSAQNSSQGLEDSDFFSRIYDLRPATALSYRLHRVHPSTGVINLQFQRQMDIVKSYANAQKELVENNFKSGDTGNPSSKPTAHKDDHKSKYSPAWGKSYRTYSSGYARATARHLGDTFDTRQLSLALTDLNQSEQERFIQLELQLLHFQLHYAQNYSQSLSLHNKHTPGKPLLERSDVDNIVDKIRYRVLEHANKQGWDMTNQWTSDNIFKWLSHTPQSTKYTHLFASPAP